MNLKNAQKALVGKTLRYHFAASGRTTTMKVARVTSCGRGSVNCTGEKLGLDIFIPSDVLYALVNFGEFTNRMEVDGVDVSESWQLN